MCGARPALVPHPSSPPVCPQTHLFKRAETAWTYAEKFATYPWGTGGLTSGSSLGGFFGPFAGLPADALYAIGELAGFFPLSLSHDGKVLLAGSGVQNGAATLISLADED